MKKSIFEIKQRAEQLMQDAIAIWRQSDYSEYLEGLENDPVFKMLITALAYRFNESDNERILLKDEILDDFADAFVPYESGHAMPAIAVVKVLPDAGIDEVQLNASSFFKLTGTDFVFTPLLNTRALNIKTKSFKRLDGRRWAVNAVMDSESKNLSGFSFALANSGYKNVRLTVNGIELPLIKPWDMHELPYSEMFSFDSQTYNLSNVYNSSMTCMEIFAKQGVLVFVVDKYEDDGHIYGETGGNVEMIFEFEDVSENFAFEKKDLLFNPVILVNAKPMEVNLSYENPIVRVAGEHVKFMHLLIPDDDQIYGAQRIRVRRVNADKFNIGEIKKLLNLMLSKFNSDFFAFVEVNKNADTDRLYRTLHNILKDMEHNINNSGNAAEGVYLSLGGWNRQNNSNISLRVRYVVTDGSAASVGLSADSIFTVPYGLDQKYTEQIVEPHKGFDEIDMKETRVNMARYYITTADRIVTKTDIRLFCITFLITRYSLSSEMIKNINISHHISDKAYSGYEILVNITLDGTPFIKRGFQNKLQDLELLMEKLIEVRNQNIYPIRVKINIE
ncbi:MAG: hypothetical protein MJZ93_00615 [Paludibacteraceae bacterium]|nr:hypothetical protein [Paludibacteraceae bacterium]